MLALTDVLGGASGGPIITEDGELVGIVSTSGGSQGEGREGLNPYPLWALPRWVIQEILQAQNDADGIGIES
jgi:S1-C subfamily serine protease